MPFPKVNRPVPTLTGTLAITLKDIPAVGGHVAARTFTYQVELLDAQGNRVDTAQGDLAPHLTAAQATALGNFLDAMRTKATEVLP